MTSLGAKVGHVRRATQDRAHTCHWPGCGRQCKPAAWGCRPHWFALPEELRHAIWAAYEPGQEATLSPSAEYVAVARRVQDWIRAHHPVVEPGPTQGTLL